MKREPGPDTTYGGIKPGQVTQGEQSEGSSPVDGLGACKKVESTVGHVTHRAASLDNPGESPSGQSSIDPGGSRYGMSRGSSDQD